MEKEINNLEQIEGEIKNLKEKKQKIQIMEKRKKYYEDKKLRLRSNNSGKANVLTRISKNFRNELDSINRKRVENGFDCLSYPKMTELIMRHKSGWKTIKNDIIHYNTGLDIEENGGEFNDK